jgi:hypothetical protein
LRCAVPIFDTQSQPPTPTLWLSAPSLPTSIYGLPDLPTSALPCQLSSDPQSRFLPISSASAPCATLQPGIVQQGTRPPEFFFFSSAHGARLHSCSSPQRATKTRTPFPTSSVCVSHFRKHSALRETSVDAINQIGRLSYSQSRE